MESNLSSPYWTGALEQECINPPGGKCVTFQRVTNFIKEKMDAAFLSSELAQ